MVARLPRRSAAALALALASCFNPAPLTTDPIDDTTVDSSTSTTTTTSSPTTTSPTTTEPTPTSASTTDSCSTCDPPRPYCLSDGGCGDCTALMAQGPGCAALSPERPNCNLNTGECVECFLGADCPSGTCNDDTGTCFGCSTDSDCGPEAPHCDLDTNMCVIGCNEHADCPETACDILAGKCFPGEQTTHTYAAPTGPGIDCQPLTACPQIQDALTVALSMGAPYIVVHVAAGHYTASLSVTSPHRTIAILAEPTSTLESNTGGAAVLVGDPEGDAPLDSTTVYIARLELTGAMSTHAVLCAFSDEVWLDDAKIYNHKGGPALEARACRLTSRRTAVFDNIAGVTASFGGTLRLVDSTVSGTAGDPALQIYTGGKLDILYSTIADRQGLAGKLLTCEQDTKLLARNSALFAEPAMLPVQCPGTITLSHSAYSAMALLGTPDISNVSVPEADIAALFTTWSTVLTLAGDGGPLRDLAEWHDGDPPTDFAGKPRPAVNGAKDVAGAYLP